ncbi:MAG: ferric reductase-like transmembrane domain-containing protein [Desulfuromonadales bacterium]|nr:ferric reductase-like transmembrane domain-containing protein [Desulfuromonadales bacterium]
MNFILSGILWICIYLVLVLTPLLVLLVRPVPGGIGFWWDFSLALGFAATTMMGVTFALTARFRHAVEPFGIDIVYYVHRRISIIALFFTLLHPVLLFAEEPMLFEMLKPASMPSHLMAAIGSLVCLLVLIGCSIWRAQLGIEYDRWRFWHILLAVAALTLAIVHIQLVGYYVDAPWKKTLWVVIPASWIFFLLYRRLVKPLLIMRRPFRVTDLRQERGNAWTLVLEPEGHAGFPFLPGQFAWVSIWNTPFAMREHPFSMASSAEHPDKLELTIKELGDYTRRIGSVQIGERAYLEGPYGIFSIDRHQAPGYVLIAGGIGVAPFMSILRTMADRADPRPVQLYYAARTWEGLTFREELQQLEASIDLETVVILEEPPSDWEGETGRISEEILARHLPKERIKRCYFVDGPVPMMEAAENALLALGIPGRDIQVELYDLV